MGVDEFLNMAFEISHASEVLNFAIVISSSFVVVAFELPFCMSE